MPTESKLPPGTQIKPTGDGKSTDENAADDTDDASTSDAESKGTVAKDSAKGTPYTPSQWALQRRSAHTDDN